MALIIFLVNAIAFAFFASRLAEASVYLWETVQAGWSDPEVRHFGMGFSGFVALYLGACVLCLFTMATIL